MYKQDMYGSEKMVYIQMLVIEWYSDMKSEVYQSIM